MSTTEKKAQAPGVARRRQSSGMKWALLYCAAFGVFAFFWMIQKPSTHMPDEGMRYQVVDYIFRHGRLPRGDDAFFSSAWGFSYAYYYTFAGPLLSALFMKIVSFFSGDAFVLLCAARFTSVLAGTISVFFTFRIARRLFVSPFRWLLPVMVSALPGFLFVTAYVNNDILAVCASSIVFYAWVCGLQDGWNLKNSVLLGGGLAFCLLSYYNAYGWVLCSLLLYFFSWLFAPQSRPARRRSMWKYAAVAAAVALGAAVFFIVRNAVLYHGDFLALQTVHDASERNAVAALKPSNRETPLNLGYSLREMLFSSHWIAGGSWVGGTSTSFFGVFGYMSVVLSPLLYRGYKLLAVIGGCGLAAGIPAWVRARRGLPAPQRRRRALLWAFLALCAAITLALDLWYSYAVDYQPQGRYLYPALLPILFFAAKGWAWLLGRLPARRLRAAAAAVFCGLYAGVSVWVFFRVYLPFG